MPLKSSVRRGVLAGVESRGTSTCSQGRERGRKGGRTTHTTSQADRHIRPGRRCRAGQGRAGSTGQGRAGSTAQDREAGRCRDWPLLLLFYSYLLHHVLVHPDERRLQLAVQCVLGVWLPVPCANDALTVATLQLALQTHTHTHTEREKETSNTQHPTPLGGRGTAGSPRRCLR